MIEFANEHGLADKIARSLTHPDNSGCWQVVLPPGFADEQGFADRLLSAVLRSAPKTLVARVHADAVHGRSGYARALAKSWNIPLDIDAPDALQTVLGRLVAHRPGIQILTHFHKIVRTLDAQVLGDLREAEQGPARRLRTVTLTPLPYSELKERWRYDGVAFSVSDYGDTHHREDPIPQPFDELRLQLAKRSVPEKLIEFALRVTGGYPAPLMAMLDRWEAEQRPSPKSTVCDLLRNTAEQRLHRFAAWLDRAGEARYCTYVCDLYHGLDVENARIHLSLHPWHQLLLGREGLRAEGVGASASTRLATMAQDNPNESQSRDLWHRAQTLYGLGHYGEVVRLLAPAPGLMLRPHLRLLSVHAEIMALLTGSVSEGSPADADWKRLILLLEQAKEQSVGLLDGELLMPRYSELLNTARDVVRSLAIAPRVVDVLSGLQGDCDAPGSAAFLLVLCLAAGKRMTGPSAALKVVVELPEQIFRCWAFVALGLNYYAAPAGCDETWNAADTEWRARGANREALKRAQHNHRFPSFSAFAFFALAERARSGKCMAAPEIDFNALDRSLSYFDKRKDFAHAVATANERDRKNYFSMIERWLDAFCAACPAGCSRIELTARADPLPLIAEDGALLE